MSRIVRLIPFLIIMAIACDEAAPPRTRNEHPSRTAARASADSSRQAIIADSLRDGYHAYRNAGGRIIMEGTMHNGRRQGVWTSYGANSRVNSRSEYSDGMLHGITTVFHDNGVLSYTGTNRRGKPFGEWRFYDAQGALARTVNYDTTGAIINDR